MAFYFIEKRLFSLHTVAILAYFIQVVKICLISIFIRLFHQLTAKYKKNTSSILLIANWNRLHDLRMSPYYAIIMLVFYWLHMA